jgi:hypothetical protein
MQRRSLTSLIGRRKPSTFRRVLSGLQSNVFVYGPENSTARTYRHRLFQNSQSIQTPKTIGVIFARSYVLSYHHADHHTSSRRFLQRRTNTTHVLLHWIEYFYAVGFQVPFSLSNLVVILHCRGNPRRCKKPKLLMYMMIVNHSCIGKSKFKILASLCSNVSQRMDDRKCNVV